MHRPSFLRRFAAATEGNVLIITGVTIVVLIAFSGAAIDLGRQQLMKNKLQQSTDAAALAGTLQSGGVTAKRRTATRYYNLNFPATYLGVARPPINNSNIVVDTGPNPSVHVFTNDNVRIPSLFMKLLQRNGHLNMTVKASSKVQDNTLAPPPYDVILVMDNSGSMGTNDGGTPNRPVPDADIPTVAAACVSYVTRYGDSAECPIDHPTYSDPVRICTEYDLSNTYNSLKEVESNYCNNMLTNDILKAAGTSRINALRLAAFNLAQQFLPDGTTNRLGVVTWSWSVIASEALTGDRTLINTMIDGMFPRGQTRASRALQSASSLFVASPRDSVKNVILLTDGRNEPSSDDTDALAECTALKTNGVVVYTIGYGANVNTPICPTVTPDDPDCPSGTPNPAYTAARNFLTNCASGDPSSNENQFFFVAPDSTTLQSNFAKIIASIKRIKIVD